jgi:CO/xanthine dehydrogenase FAD-binding subunit
MKETTWHYPKSINEAYYILQSEKGILHAGGTWLKPAILSKYTAIIDLNNTKLNYFIIGKKNIRMGAMLSLNEIKENLSGHFQSHILIDAIKQAAAEPLRNRITIGGSIAAFPIWSDIVGPLLSLNAKVSLYGTENKEADLETYLSSPKLKSNYLIKEVTIPVTPFYYFFYKEAKTHFDYAAFTISLSVGKFKKQPELPSFILTGVKSKYIRLKEAEIAFQKYKKDTQLIENEIFGLNPEFLNKNGRSNTYLASIAKIKLLNGVKKVLLETIIK